MTYLPVLVFIALLLVVVWFGRRARQRAQAQSEQQLESITFGTEVMTTSGLYGTVVGINDDESVQLAIAPGVEVKWATAALRDAASLPARYRSGITGSDEPPADPQADEPPLA